MSKIVCILIALLSLTTGAASVAVAGPKLRTIPPETVAEMRRKGEPVTLVQINGGSRTPVIHGSARVQLNDIDEWAAKTDKNTMIVCYCTCPANETGNRAAKRLMELGFRNVYVFEGGLKAWNDMVKERQQRAPM